MILRMDLLLKSVILIQLPTAYPLHGLPIRNYFSWPSYYEWIRSPSPFNVYPKIFTKIQQQHHQQLQEQQRQPSPSKRSTTYSHSTSWGKRSTSHSTSWGKRSSSTGIRKKFMSIGTSPWNLIRFGLKRNVQSEPQPFDNMDIEDNFAKRIWLPNGDYEDIENATNNEIIEEDTDNVVKKYLGFYPLPRSSGPLYALVNSLNLKTLKKKLISKDMVRRIENQWRQNQLNRMTVEKRRMGMIQTSTILPEPNRECDDYIDQVTRNLCYFLLTRSNVKLVGKWLGCSKGCFGVGVKRNRAGSGVPGEMSNLVPIINEGTGKKYRKIFVRI